MRCSLCSSFILDHFETSAHITFPARYRRIPYRQLLEELEHVLFPTLEYSCQSKTIRQQCSTMEVFCGKEVTTRRFFECYPSYKEVVESLSLTLWEAGVGKRDVLHLWLEDEIYRLFHLLPDIHLEHTGQEEPKALRAPPLFDRLGPAAQARLDAQKGVAKDDTKAVVTYARDVDDTDLFEDDLYR